ncbi:MAG: hypothetical protein II885_18580 [Oscillospiraceae bacterium]|nr:hypothetical protein [Oscillospiraceae bacterium]
MNKTLSNSMYLLTLATYAASVFMLADGKTPLVIVFLAAGSCFMYLASMGNRKEAQEKNEDNK